MTVPLFFAFFAALAISMACLPLLKRFADQFGLLDQPGERRMHAVPVSRLGGLAIALGALVAILVWLPKDRAVYAYLVGALIILALGVCDDLLNLNYKIKFAVQLLATMVVVFGGGITLEHIFFQVEAFVPQWAATLLTLFFFIGVTNAVNLSDGLDGLAGGLCFLSFGGFALFGYLSGAVVPVAIAVSMMGAIYGFLRSNTYPANIFMGDGGSQFLGFSLSTLGVMATQSGHGNLSLSSSLFILGIPVIDTLGVLIQRCLSGTPPFKADNKHLHHKLLTLGFFHGEAVIVVYALQWGMLILAYGLRFSEDAMAWGGYAGIVLPFLFLYVLSAFGSFNTLSLKRDRRRSVLRPVKWWIKQRPWAMEKPIQLLEVGLCLFLILGVFLPLHVSHDVSIAALVLFGLVLLCMTLWRRVAPYIIRLGLYVVSAFLVYFSMGGTDFMSVGMQRGLNLFYLLTAFLVIFNALVQLMGERPFQITPLDYLVVFFVLSASLAKIEVAGTEIGLFSAKLITLFIAYELILNRFSGRIFRFGFVILWVFLALGVRGWV